MNFSVIDLGILFGGLLAIVTAIAQILRPNKKFGNIEFFITFLLSGVLCIYLLVHFSEPNFDYNYTASPLFFLILYLASPLYYLYSHRLLIGVIDVKTKHIIHIVPAIGAFIISIFNVTGILTSSSFQIILRNHEVNTVQYLLSIFWLIHMAVYIILLEVKFFINHSYYTINKNMYPVLITLLYLKVALVVQFIAKIVFNPFLMKISLLMISIINVVWYAFTYIYPDKYSDLDECLGYKPVSNKRKSLLNRLNIDELHHELEELIENGKIFCDEDLTLNKLAALLGISHHQLSEFLNKELKMNFNNYINYHRIEEAKRLLILDTDRSILSIALSSGFNSTSVFYSAFMKFTGQTPVKYQKTCLQNS